MNDLSQDMVHTNPVSRFISDHPMFTFIALSYAVSWMTIPILGDPIGTGPFVAAVVVLSVTQGWPGVRSLGRQMVHWRVHWGWYALAVGLPTVTAFASAWIAVGLGADAPTSAQLAGLAELPINIVIYMLIPLQGPWEEPGFRGYALNHLTRTRSVLVASLLIAVIHVFWHTPLFFSGNIPASDVVWIVAASVVFAFVVSRTGSVLLAMLMHATNNIVSGEYVTGLFSGDDSVLQGWVRATVWSVIAVVVVLFAGRSFTTRPQSERLSVEPVLGSA